MAAAALAALLYSLRPSLAAVDGHIYVNASALHVERLYGDAAAPGSRRALTAGQKQAVLSKHNALRSAVTAPCTASDMQTLAWDETLAAAAEGYAARCVWHHDPENHANGWGENLAMRWESWKNSYTTETLVDMVQSWYDEVVDTDWTAGSKFVKSKVYADPAGQCKSPEGAGQCMIGHYTQVVWAASTRVGCGAVACDQGLAGQGGVMFVCKYSPAGNTATSDGLLLAPYMVGASCAGCPRQCSSSLCAHDTAPARCEDKITTMVFNGVPYTDCRTLIAATAAFGSNSWCGEQEPKFKICQLSCQMCAVPAGVGAGFCGQNFSGGAVEPNATPGNPTPAPTQAPHQPAAIPVFIQQPAPDLSSAGDVGALVTKKLSGLWNSAASFFRGTASSLKAELPRVRDSLGSVASGTGGHGAGGAISAWEHRGVVEAPPAQEAPTTRRRLLAVVGAGLMASCAAVASVARLVALCQRRHVQNVHAERPPRSNFDEEAVLLQ